MIDDHAGSLPGRPSLASQEPGDVPLAQVEIGSELRDGNHEPSLTRRCEDVPTRQEGESWVVINRFPSLGTLVEWSPAIAFWIIVGYMLANLVGYVGIHP